APKAMAPLAEEAFGWAEFGEPEAQIEVAPAWLDSDQVPSGDEALAWLEQLAEGKEEELQAQIKAEAEVRMAEIMGRPVPAEPPAPEIAPEEPPPAPPDAVGEARLEEALALQFGEAFGWTEFGEPEVQIGPAPAIPPVEEAPPPVIEEVVGIVEIEAAAPPPEKAIAPPPVVPTIKAPAGPFADERAYLNANPRDYDAWLALARALWQANEQEESLTAYYRVTRSGKLIEAVIPDLEGYLEQQPDVRVHQALGDAYMKNGQLQEALDLYRRALEIL
ncbi:MAG: tetratricopeptide repeat protein, partial [Chloroflexi bacterium]|nr:tetratricopeptide repeat protein [Chloroflexota bacterium]